MKISKTITLDMSDLNGMINLAEKRKMTLNEFIGFMWRDFAKKEGIAEAQIIQCKICGTKYSNVLTDCPGCVFNETEATIEQKQAQEDKNKRAEENNKRMSVLTTEKLELVDKIRLYTATLDRMIKEERNDQADRITLELNDMRKRYEEIEDELRTLL